jgi:hypothetical protein
LSLIHEQRDRLAAAADQAAQFALAFLALLGDPDLALLREVVEQGVDQGGDRGALLIDGERLGHQHLVLAREVGLQVAQQRSFAVADHACNRHQPAGQDRGANLAAQLPVMLGLEIAGGPQFAC